VAAYLAGPTAAWQVLATVFSVFAESAAAQQPVTTPATQQPTSPPPATHVVREGETLWSLAQQYFGDPLLWPEIYRLNTTVVEDPHWIYPGEELRLVPLEGPPPVTVEPEAVTVTPPAGEDTLRPAPPPQMAAQTPTIFAARSRPVTPQQAIEVQQQRAYRAVRAGEYYSAGFLTEGQDLSSGKILGNVQTSTVRRLTTASSAMQFTDVVVEPPPEPVSVGDLLLSYVTADEVPGFGFIVRPTGLLEVLTSAEATGNVSARVMEQYRQITNDQRVIRVSRFSFPRGVFPESVATNAITGEVVALREPREVVALQDVLFLNRGSEDGVRLGDVFLVTGLAGAREGIGQVEHEQARVLVVNTRARSSSAVVIELYRPDIRPGSAARQVRRMPS
jgi:LysM repeat protein